MRIGSDRSPLHITPFFYSDLYFISIFYYETNDDVVEYLLSFTYYIFIVIVKIFFINKLLIILNQILKGDQNLKSTFKLQIVFYV